MLFTINTFVKDIWLYSVHQYANMYEHSYGDIPLAQFNSNNRHGGQDVNIQIKSVWRACTQKNNVIIVWLKASVRLFFFS